MNRIRTIYIIIIYYTVRDVLRLVAVVIVMLYIATNRPSSSPDTLLSHSWRTIYYIIHFGYFYKLSSDGGRPLLNFVRNLLYGTHNISRHPNRVTVAIDGERECESESPRFRVLSRTAEETRHGETKFL